MTRSELIGAIAGVNPHLRLGEVEHALDTIFGEIAEALARGNRVELRGFGTFSVKTRSSRVGRNPRTGEAVLVREKHVLRFKAGKSLRLAINSKT